ncbi:MAG: hypothetical protein H6738_18775 [Alphaproteobacteria bacterium]|nr:hypothetical protein [Alphaproteobacteria bacterium]MCB9698832.1 hypothetical protein [Alphaproteobacteria bacterium]
MPDVVVGAFHERCSAAPVLRWCLPEDGLRTFAAAWVYFRWADDLVDAPDRDPAEVRRFVADQAALLAGARDAARLEEEALVACLADPVRGPAMRTACARMLEALRFDAHRPPRSLAPELEAQIARIGDAYATALWACAHEGRAPTDVPAAACALARAATAAHQVRDLHLDLRLGYDNVPEGEERGPTWVAARKVEVDARFARWLPGLRGLSWRPRWAFRLLAWKYRVALWRAA